jgi:hypothetical protein
MQDDLVEMDDYWMIRRGKLYFREIAGWGRRIDATRYSTRQEASMRKRGWKCGRETSLHVVRVRVHRKDF